MYINFYDILLGAFSSHFSKLAYYLMIGHHFQLLPFISLDYPLACDTTDHCSLNDIMRRNFTINDVINHCPECQKLGKEGLPWGIHDGSDADPCGIYST